MGFAIALALLTFCRDPAICAESPPAVLPAVGSAPTTVVGTYAAVSGWSGPLLRIRRSAVDAGEQDVSADASGFVAEAAVLAFTGQSTLDGTLVSGLYDQSGHGYDFSQSAPELMPMLSTDPEGRPVIVQNMTNTAYFNAHASLTVTTNALTYLFLGRFVSGALFQPGASTGTVFQLDGVNGLKLTVGNMARDAPFAPYENTSVILVQSGATSLRYHQDERSGLAGSAAAVSSLTGGRLANSTVSNAAFKGDFSLFAIYPAMLSDTDAATLKTEMMGWRGITTKSKVLVFCEDSQSAGSGSTYNRNRSYYALTDSDIRTTTRVYNRSKGGRSLTTAHANYAGEMPLRYQAGFTNVAAILGGTNDIVAEGDSGAAAWADYQTYAADFAATGFIRIAYNNPFPDGGGDNDAFNALMDANWPSVAAAKVDLRNSLLAGDLHDSVHPNNDGYLKWWNVEKPTIKSQLGLGVDGTPAPEIAVTRSGTAVADGGTDTVVGLVAGTGTATSYQIANTGSAALTVGAPAVGSQVNCTVTVTTSPAASVASGGTTALGVTVTPSSAGAWSCTVSFATNDSDENPINWTMSGTATAAGGGTGATSTGGQSGGGCGLGVGLNALLASLLLLLGVRRRPITGS